MKNAFNKRVTLKKIVPVAGSGEPVTEASYTAWADVYDVGITTKYTALNSGAEITLGMEMWRSEFEKGEYTHAEYSGKTYRISQVGRAKNDLHIKIMLERS